MKNNNTLSKKRVKYIINTIAQLENKIIFYTNNKNNTIPLLFDKIKFCKKKLENFKYIFELYSSELCKDKFKNNELVEDILTLEEQIIEYHTELTVKLRVEIDKKNEHIKKLENIIRFFKHK